MDRETLGFVRVGLERYPSARETVTLFETIIQKAIFNALHQHQWRAFSPTRNSKSELVIAKGKGDTFFQSWMECGVVSRDSKFRYVYLGVYWEDPVVAAVGIWDAKWKALPLQSPVAIAAPVRFNPSDQSLQIALGADFDPDVDFKRLLVALDEALCPQP